jgi:hypothetical protein
MSETNTKFLLGKLEEKLREDGSKTLNLLHVVIMQMS